MTNEELQRELLKHPKDAAVVIVPESMCPEYAEFVSYDPKRSEVFVGGRNDIWLKERA